MTALERPVREDIEHIGRDLHRMRARIARLERLTELDDIDTLLGVAEAEVRRFAPRLPRRAASL